MPTDALLVFLKWPEPGQAKTRLIPLLGPTDAARLYARFAAHVVAVAREWAAADPAQRRVIGWVSPAERTAAVANWLGLPVTDLRPQPPTDLGARLVAAFADAFSGADRVAAIGTDCLAVTPDHLNRAFDALNEQDAAIGPAVDGGYWLIALGQPVPSAFADIPWSTADVLSVTRQRLTATSVSFTELDTLPDIDTPDDLVAALPDWHHWLATAPAVPRPDQPPGPLHRPD